MSDDREIPTTRVLRSWTAARLDGATALVFETESGPIALGLSLEIVRILQRQLADAETFLQREPGNA